MPGSRHDNVTTGVQANQPTFTKINHNICDVFGFTVVHIQRLGLVGGVELTPASDFLVRRLLLHID